MAKITQGSVTAEDDIGGNIWLSFSSRETIKIQAADVNDVRACLVACQHKDHVCDGIGYCREHNPGGQLP